MYKLYWKNIDEQVFSIIYSKSKSIVMWRIEFKAMPKFPTTTVPSKYRADMKPGTSWPSAIGYKQESQADAY